MRRCLFFFTILMFTLGLVAVEARKQKETAPDYMVRVAIARDAREFNLEVDGPYTFRDGSNGNVIAKEARLPRSTVRLLDKGIFIGGNVYPQQRIIITPVRDAGVIINKRRFRGEVVLIRTDNRVTVVNSINIEDYIKGVLYHEVSHQWAMEALKAQAVAARTYAIYSMGNSKNKDYDVTNDIYSQVYGGKNSERYRTGLAVDRSAGEVLTFKGKILPAYFHACCGGMTEDAKELWNADLAPLKGVPCTFCADAPHMKWKKNFRLQNIQESLNKAGFQIGAIKEIIIERRNRSDRVEKLRVIGRQGEEVIVSGKQFREIIGPNVLRSNNYEVVMQGYYVDFVGKGWGHGVGLCQWGARGMSIQQFTYKQILNYYYPRAELVDYHALR